MRVGGGRRLLDRELVLKLLVMVIVEYSLPAGSETLDRSQIGAAPTAFDCWTLLARRLKYWEMVSTLLDVSRETLGKVGAAHTEAALSADTRSREVCIVYRRSMRVCLFVCLRVGKRY